MTEIWTVPGFTHVRELGTGDTGRVVQAVDDLTRTPVAVKYLDERLRRDERFQSRFRGEARLLSRLEDPNLAQFYDYVETPQGVATVTELVEGVSLARLMDAHGPTGSLAALAVFSGSLMGLAALHGAGLAHGRYKPADVLIDRSGTGKLTDVGMTTGDPARAGNPAYLAPEQWDGAPPGPAGDLYAATAAFYECLTGRPPFRARNLTALAKAHRTEPVPLDAVPEPLRGLAAAGLAKAPADRPASAADFLAALDDAAVSAFGPDWEAAGRGRLAELAAAAAATPPPAAARPRGAGPAQGSRPGRRRLITWIAVAVVLIAAIVYGVILGTGSGGTTSPTQNSSPLPGSATPSAAKGTPAPQTPAALADAISRAAAKQRTVAFAHRRDACCGAAIAARGVLSFTSTAPAAYDMTVWSPVRGHPYARRTRTILVGDIAYVAAGRAWHPAPAAGQAPAAAGQAARSDPTRGYASMAAQTRWGTSLQTIVALLRSSRTVSRSGLTYSGTASLSALTRDGSVAPLYAQFASSPGGARVVFRVQVDRDFLPRSLQVTVSSRQDGRVRSQVFHTTYSGWGRKVSINKPR